MKIQERVRLYLQQTEGTYIIGQSEYYARIALSQALRAFEDKNYGIGAVALLVKGDTIEEYQDRNAMVTGLGVVDHAETRALLKLKSGKQPDETYRRDLNEWTRKLPAGISVFGTLEPCPMCTCTLTNVGAVQSVSTVRDGDLIQTNEGYKISNGAANVILYEEDANGGKIIRDKYKIQPLIWQQIQIAHKISFQILQTTDEELKQLSLQIFVETREEIDRRLGERGLFTYTADRAASLFI